MKQRVLLLEPNYRNKYPPMGLMKIAMYHRLQGFDVAFYKGDFNHFIISELTDDACKKLREVDRDFDWLKLRPEVFSFIHTGSLKDGSSLEHASTRPFALKWLEHYRKSYKSGAYYKKPRWDRVCVTTLFTFHWDITIKTIEFAKMVCKNQTQVLVGGVMASVVPEEVEKATGVKPHTGCLHVKRLFNDKPLNTTIENLPLDYSILEEIDYDYPASDAYFAYATRGCINKCAFCAVPIIEPRYRSFIPLKKKIIKTSVEFGEKRNLLLLDNNVLASPKFDKIISDIRNSGFAKGATFIPPNDLDIAINKLKASWNDRAYIRMAVKLLNNFVDKLNGDRHDYYYTLLLNHGLIHDYTATKDNILSVYKEIRDEYSSKLSQKPLKRYIDFNQGIDARLVTDENMKTLSSVAIRPLRIAFDSWAERKHYERAVKLAHKNGINHMSNYLLYNFMDKPIDLYNRISLNINLCEKLGVNIYSFPMKYHPITDKQWFSNRNYIGKYWSRKAIRTIQAVLNSTMGKIGRGKTFFLKAFGRNEDEFYELLMMPESFIIKRWDAELSGLTGKWRRSYSLLNEHEQELVNDIISVNVFNKSDWKKYSLKVRKFLDFYLIDRDSVPVANQSKKQRYISAFEDNCLE